MRILSVFMNGIILENALVLRHPFLIILSKSSLKVYLLSALILIDFDNGCFQFKKDQYPLYIIIFTNN